MKFPNAPWAEEWVRLLRNRADTARFRRGEEYAREGAVTRLVVQPGRIVAKVQGSRPHPYDVLITAPTLKIPPQLRALSSLLAAVDVLSHSISYVTALLPPMDHVQFVCTCPDWSDPCKHGVAVWLAAAERWAAYPEQFFFFRGIPVSAPPVPEERPGAKQPDLGDRRAGQHDGAAAGRERLMAVQAPRREIAAHVGAREFWEGGSAALESCAEPGDGEPLQAPAYVFVPPVAWPDWLEPYGKLMARVYAALSDGRETDAEDQPGSGEPEEEWEENWQAELAAYLMRRWAEREDGDGR